MMIAPISRKEVIAMLFPIISDLLSKNFITANNIIIIIEAIKNANGK